MEHFQKYLFNDRAIAGTSEHGTLGAWEICSLKKINNEL